MTKKVLISLEEGIKILSDDITDEMINKYNQTINFIPMRTSNVTDAEVLTVEDINSFNTRKISEGVKPSSFVEGCIPTVEVKIPEMDMIGWDKDLKSKDPKFHLRFYSMDNFINNNQLSTVISYMPDYNKQRVDYAGTVNVLHACDNRYIKIDSNAYRRDYGTRFDHRISILDKYNSLKEMDDRFTDIGTCMRFYKAFVKQLQETYNVSLYKKIIDETIPKIEEMLNKDENFDYETLEANDEFY
jgi:nitrogenase molybdenum-iron protein alpha/beta subunit